MTCVTQRSHNIRYTLRQRLWYIEQVEEAEAGSKSCPELISAENVQISTDSIENPHLVFFVYVDLAEGFRNLDELIGSFIT